MKNLVLLAVLCYSASVNSQDIPVPDPSSCTLTLDIYGDDNNYIKSTCWLVADVSQADAVGLCNSYNMELFTINTAKERHDLILSSYIKGTGQSIWVSGKNRPNYVDTNDGVTSLNSNAFPSTNGSGNCIVLNSELGVYKYELTTSQCSDQKSVYCQWINPSPSNYPLYDPFTIPLGQLNTKVCDFKLDVYDEYENYYSSFCWKNLQGTQAQAVTFCQTYGMTLYTITSDYEREALFLTTLDMGTGAEIWVSGKKNSNGNYVDSNDGTTELSTDAVPTIGNSSFNCVEIFGVEGVASYSLKRADCNVHQKVYCKWLNDNPTNPHPPTPPPPTGPTPDYYNYY